MATLNRQRLALCASVGTRCPLVASVLVVAHIVAFDFSQGAPVTFRFDATVINASAGNPFDLPFNYHVGDVISGKVSFEPGVGTPISHNAIEAEQFLPLEFVIGGIAFGSSSYSIEVFNDDAFDDAEPPLDGLLDTMKLECSPSAAQPCAPDPISLAGSDPFSIGVRLELVGDDLIHSTPEISGDSLVLNSFVLRRLLTIGFGNDIGGSMSLSAAIGKFTEVPEPSSGLMFMAIVIVGGFGYRYPR